MVTSVTGQALSGIRVIAVSRGWSPATLCGQLLADLGADVSRAVDSLSTVDAAAVDIVVTDGIGLAEPADWWSVNPRIVGATITPYGRSEGLPYVPEFVLQAEAGITATTGYPDGPPTRAGVSLGTHASAFIACAGLLAARLEAEQTGVGSWLDVAQLDAMTMMLGNALPGYFTGTRSTARAGNAQPLSAPWNSYPARDGDVVIVAISDARWHDLLRIVGRPDLIGAARYANKTQRVRHRAEVDDLIAAWTRSRDTAEIMATLDRARIAASPVHAPAEALRQPIVAERGIVTTAGLGPVLRLHDLHARPATPRLRAIDGADPERGRPLAGVRVVELGGHTAAALCTRLLADLGADVIKVELPRGDDARYTVPVLSDGSSFLWHSWNVGKRSVVLDLAQPEGSAILDDLLADSDVFVENLAADSLRSLGFAPETVLANHSHLVYCAVSGFGATGSQRDRRAYDTVLQAFAGIMAVTGQPNRRPVKVGPSIVDNLSALCAAVAVLGALHRRRRTGRGGLADVALLDVAYWVMAEWWPQVASGRPATRVGNRRPGQPLENSYRCADGVEVAVSADDPQVRSAAVALFGTPTAESAWDALVAQHASTVDSAMFLAQCRAHGIPASRHHDIGAVAAHPVVRRRSMLVPLTVAGGDPCVLIGTPFTWHDGRRSGPARWHAPRLGEHTDEVLRELRGRPGLRPREPEHEGAQQ